MCVLIRIDEDCVVDILKIVYLLTRQKEDGTRYVYIKFNDTAGSSLNVFKSMDEVFGKIKKVTSSPQFKETFPEISKRFELMDIE